MTQDQLLRAAGPVNQGILKRICELSNEELAPLVDKLRDYPYPSVEGYAVPLERGARCSLNALREIACSFGGEPKMEEDALRTHGHCLIGFANTIYDLSRMNPPRIVQVKEIIPPAKETRTTVAPITVSERALAMRKKKH
jgi:hypothetical protein